MDLHGKLWTGEDYYKLQRPRTKRQDRLVSRRRRGTWVLPYEYPGQVTVSGYGAARPDGTKNISPFVNT